METRIQLLTDLIKLQRDLSSIKTELSQFSWDSDEVLVVLTKSDFIRVAEEYLNDRLSTTELEDWANAIEGRDDIDFEFEKLEEYIFQLANPITNGEINKSLVQEMLYFK